MWLEKEGDLSLKKKIWWVLNEKREYEVFIWGPWDAWVTIYHLPQGNLNLFLQNPSHPLLRRCHHLILPSKPTTQAVPPCKSSTRASCLRSSIVCASQPILFSSSPFVRRQSPFSFRHFPVSSPCCLCSTASTIRRWSPRLFHRSRVFSTTSSAKQ